MLFFLNTETICIKIRKCFAPCRFRVLILKIEKALGIVKKASTITWYNLKNQK